MPPIPDQDLRQAIDSIRSASSRLNALTDTANETVREVEAFLTEECSIGIPATVIVHQDYPLTQDGPTALCLEYRRVGQRFRIAVVEAGSYGEEISVKPWSECPRALKLETFPRLPALLTTLAEKVEEGIKEAEAAASTVASILGGLRKAGHVQE